MLLFAAALVAAAPTPAVAAPDSLKPSTSESCPRTTNYYAWQRGKSLKPHKLTELPPAIGYMAIFRHIGPCEAPLTMVDYRNARRR
jgi:hypothetical protein